MKNRRNLLVLLTLVLVVCLLTGTVFAAGTFTDVPGDAYYAQSVNWAVDKGITKGTSDTTFSPNDSCTRAQMITFLWRYAGAPKATGSNPFQDVANDAYYRDAVLWAYDKGITAGTDATHFSPDGTVKRAEAVTFLWRAAGSPPTGSTGNFSDVAPDQYFTDAVAWGRDKGVVMGTSDTTFSPNDPCTRAQIVTFLYRFSQLPASEGAGSINPQFPGEGILSGIGTTMPDASTLNVTKYPVVLVHGLLGWGTYDEINPLIPYWGMTATNVNKYLVDKGVECYSASVGPCSSAWDRACELYAQLTGTVTDYGAAHAEKYGHDRYGRDYTGSGKYSKLIQGTWDAQHPINLVGHSFGGATSRLLATLLKSGSAEEQAYMAAHPEAGTISPLFTGGKADWIYSITALAAPSNGTTFIEANNGFTYMVADLCEFLAKALGPTPFKGIYDFQMEHFGVQPQENDNLIDALREALSSGFMDHNDNAYQDLTIDKAMHINDSIEMLDNVYYFSWYGDRTYYDAETGTYKPKLSMQLLALPFSTNMGSYVGTTQGWFYDGYGAHQQKVTVKPTFTGQDWQPNDGLVNVMSGRWPARWINGVWTSDPHMDGVIGAKVTQKGIWHVMPVQEADHLTFMGNIFDETPEHVQEIYDGVIANIVACGG